MAVHDPLLVNRWQAIFAAWRQSGLSVVAFCRSRGLTPSSFYRWRLILDTCEPTAATATRGPDDPPPPPFVPVRVMPDVVVDVILPSGVQLRVPLTADAGQVARLVLALGGGSC